MHLFLQEIHEQPQAVRATAGYLSSPEGRAALDAVAKRWHEGAYERVVVTGMGSSFFIGEAFAIFCNRNGIPAFCINAGELLHYGQAIIDRKTMLLAISQSGESYETVKLIETCRHEREAIVALTNAPDSRLARLSGHVLLTKAGSERMTSTKTFITAWQTACSLALTLCRESVPESLWEEMASGIETLLSRTDVREVAASLAPLPFLSFSARGTDMAAARQSALMCMEALHLPATALCGGDFRHGPLEMAGPGKALVVLTSSASPTYAQSRHLAQDFLRFGGSVVWVSDQALPKQEGLWFLPIPAVPAELALIPAIIPLQLLVCAIADIKGILPGDFHHGGKVTSIE